MKLICNDKQRWNDEKCRCECKESIDKGVCKKEFIKAIPSETSILLKYSIYNI